MDNFTEEYNATDDCPFETNLYIQISGTVLFVLVWPFIVLDMKWFPLGRPAAALVGAALMVLFQVVSQNEVYEIEGEKGSLQTTFLLVGMMMLSYYYNREGLLKKTMVMILGDNQDKPFHTVLWKVCVVSALLSAFITNDATCLVITPLLLTEFVNQGRDSRELLPLCLGIATSANIGSAATVFGNPQNAFIASEAGVTLLQFFIAELPAAALGLVINVGLIYFFIVRRICKERLACKDEEAARSNQQEVDSSLDRVPILSQFCCPKVEAANVEDHKRDNNGDIELHAANDSEVNSAKINHSSNLPSDALDEETLPVDNVNATDINNCDDDEEKEEADEKCKCCLLRQKMFKVWLVFITFVMIVLLAIPPSVADFNLGCIPLAASIFTMLMDTILNRNYAYDVMLKIDWTVILMFMGLFVWLEGFQRTCFPNLVFNKLEPFMNLKTIEGVLLFSVFVIIGSNLFSNVPLVILIVNRISGLCGDDPCEGPLGGLLLAWISTIAGNFTLIGSVANLIVAEKARSSANYRLSFLGYLKFGFFSTLIIIYTCLPIVYFMGMVAGYI